MKKATCRDMRGACDAEFEGEPPEYMGQSGDEAHKTAMDNMMELRKEEQEKRYEEFRSRFDSSQDA
jgi:hypothetical protein